MRHVYITMVNISFVNYQKSVSKVVLNQ